MKKQLASVLVPLVLSGAASAFGGNLLTNPGFDSAAQLSGWSDTAGKSWSSTDAAGAAASGSLRIETTAIATLAVTQCVPVGASKQYGFGSKVFVTAQGNAQGKAGIVVRSFAGAGCTNEIDPGFPAFSFVTEALSGQWRSLSSTLTTKSNARSALVELRLTKTSGSGGASFAVNQDDAFLSPTVEETTTTTTTVAETTTSTVPETTTTLPEPTTTLETTTTTTVADTSTTTLPPSADCADPSSPKGKVTAADALFVLRSSVGQIPCAACVCDVNGSGSVTATDALATLRIAVGYVLLPDCPACG